VNYYTIYRLLQYFSDRLEGDMGAVGPGGGGGGFMQGIPM